jgi:predicted O-linked N-acetylglucosamine transferase (SPINDLY family)
MPPGVTALFGQALALHQAGRLIEAERLYAEVLRSHPRHFDSLHLLGVAHHQRGRYEEAIRQIDAALKENPGAATAHNNRGAAFKELGRLPEALASYDKAIALKPAYVDALYNRGTVLKELGRDERALADFDRVISLKPDHAVAFNNRGNALKDLQRFDEALASFDRAVALRPDYAEAWHNRATALNAATRFEEALASCDRAIALRPDFAEAFNNRGNTLNAMQRFAEAVECYDRALALKPGEGLYNRGAVLLALGRFEDAAASLSEAIKRDPDQDNLKGAYLHARMGLCDWSNFDGACAELDVDVAAGRAAIVPFQLLASPSTAAAQLACARTFVCNKYPPCPAPVWRGERYGHARIRIAYLSADLNDHPVAHLAAGMFARHDRSRFETFAIAFDPDKPSEMRDRLKGSFDSFIDANAMSDEQVAGLLRDLEVDIAVDLSGFTKGLRPGIFARRLAPVQVNYLGYAGTLGQDYWDYIIADRFVIPEESHKHYAEKVAYLPDTFMVTDSSRGISQTVPSRTQAGLPESGFVFCCFNNTYKLTPDLFDVWMRLLREVEGSVLWLSKGNAVALGNLRREAEQRGVAGERLVFASRVVGIENHLARLGLADLFLDTLHYNAHATAADALRAGVPVLTCPRATFASRVAGSLVSAVGMPELITARLADYETLALRLARDPERLAAMRQKLARNLQSFPLFDTERFTRHIEAAYTTMWERAERGERPESFAVAPIERRA